MSNLIEHAEKEMKMAGLYDGDSDYAGMLPEAVMKLVRAHASEEHSGGSHARTLSIFNRVINFKTLGPITSSPDEWMKVGDTGGPDGKPVFQNRRQGSCFSNDGGKTYYDIDAGDDRAIKTAKEPKA